MNHEPYAKVQEEIREAVKAANAGRRAYGILSAAAMVIIALTVALLLR